MQELVALVAGEFAVSVLMGLAALCLFLWAAMSGLFTDVEEVKHQVLRSEGIDDEGARR
jgi:cbb3-type cytochrome oxidase maturation protein